MTFIEVEKLDIRDKQARDQRMLGTNCNFATPKYNFLAYYRDEQRIF